MTIRLLSQSECWRVPLSALSSAGYAFATELASAIVVRLRGPLDPPHRPLAQPGRRRPRHRRHPAQDDHREASRGTRDPLTELADHLDQLIAARRTETE